MSALSRRFGIATTVLLVLVLGIQQRADSAQFFLPLEQLAVAGAGTAPEAELLALRLFAGRIQQLTGTVLRQFWGSAPESGSVALRVGNLSSLQEQGTDMADAEEFVRALKAEEIQNQSYAIALRAEGATPLELIAAGLGRGDSARAFLGLGYALGELLRRVELRDGQWGISLPEQLILRSPATPQRTLYLNSGAGRPEGVTLEHWDEQALEAYVDFLIEARYSRISFWQAHPSYLFPGHGEQRHAANVHMHQVLRHLFQYARRRGLEVYHQITPAYYDVAVHGDNGEQFRGVGWYTRKPGHGGVCWSKPEARKMARDIARLEMEYYAPFDGYVTWFYDPAGCFCDQCRPNQAEVLYHQFKLIADLAQTASPGAGLQAVLWPTWIFPQYEHDGIPFNAEERDAFVTDFLARLKTEYPAGDITIVDSSEGPNTNIHNSLVDKDHFRLNGFIYSLLGYPGESAYPFMPFHFHEQERVLRNAQGYGVHEVTLYDHYAPVTMPVVYGFAHLLYDAEATAQDALEAYAASVAKGEAYTPFVRTLQALESMDQGATYAARGEHLAAAETAWETARSAEHLYVSREWLDGYVLAQRHYLAMAQAPDAKLPPVFEQFRAELAEIPMYSAFIKRLPLETVKDAQLVPYWRSRVTAAGGAGVPDH